VAVLENFQKIFFASESFCEETTIIFNEGIQKGVA
jgi:hypothetical protein